MVKAHLPTHIVAGEPSSRSKIVYTKDCLENLLMQDINVPGYFGKLASNDFAGNFNEDAHPPGEYTLVGFDIIEDRLFVQLEAEELVIQSMLNNDYIVRFLTLDFRPDSNNEVHEVNIRGVLLEQECNNTSTS